MFSGGSTDNRPFSSTAVHSCNTGYTLTGGSTRTCVSGGSWDGSPPMCQSKSCVCEYIYVPKLNEDCVIFLVDTSIVHSISLTGVGGSSCQHFFYLLPLTY